jgi:hypothetical protein
MTTEPPKSPRTVADVEGPWSDPDFESGLVDRCRLYWSVPVTDVPNSILALFLRQRIAVELVKCEAQKRLDSATDDGSEQYEGELAEAVASVRA